MSCPSVWRRQALLLAGAVMLTVACSGSDASTNDRSGVRAAVSDSSVGPGVREGTWQDSDERSTWRATLDGPHITQIDEVSSFTDSATSTRRFQFDASGSLRTFREERRQVLYGRTAVPDTIRTFIELQWEQDSLARSAKRVNDADRLLQPYEVDNFRVHASELLRIVRAGTATSPRDRTP